MLASLIPAVDFCERTSWVEGYAWFMSRISGDPYNSLLSGSGVLTAAGLAYIQMPVHDTNLFYRIPGRLQAERYVTMNKMNIAPTTDTNGLADMISSAAGGSVDYNIQVDSSGNYPLSFRAAGATGQIKIYKGGTLLGTATSATTSWSTVSTTVSLAAGTNTLHVVLASNAQQLNWMEFLATNGTPSIPSGLSATAGGTQVVLNWSGSSGATSYNVKYSTTNGGTYTTIASPTTTSFTNSGLATGTTYYYVVSAVNAAGASTNSIQVSATTAFPPVNLALNKPVTVSSIQSASYPGSNAVDGNTGTRWSSASSDPQWIYVDLQDTYSITEVKLNWETAYGKSYQIQVSSDATNWSTIYSTNSGAGSIEDLTGVFGTGRYVRMYGTVRGTVYGYSLWEFVVYGTAPTPAGLTATAGNMQVSLSWNASPGATSYNVKSAVDSGGTYMTVANVTTPSYTNTGLANGTTYYYVVSALNAFSESPNSTEVSAMPTNHRPVLAAIPNQTVLAGRTLLITNSASDADVPPQLLTYSLPGAPSGAFIDTNSGVFTWRPAIAQSPSTQTVVVVVSDSGVPALTATQSFSVTVILPALPTLSAASFTNGQFGFWINGNTGPDYTIQASTNLTSWVPLYTNNSPPLPCFWVDTNSSYYQFHFYRVSLGP